MDKESDSRKKDSKIKELFGGMLSIAMICCSVGFFAVLLAFGFNKMFHVQFGTALLSGSVLSATAVMMSFITYLYTQVDARLRIISSHIQQNGISTYNVSVLLSILLERAGMITTSIAGNDANDTELH